MKSDWDKLAKDFKDSKTQLVADVDCTSGGESLCEQFGVEGFPTIKWGDPSDLQEYQGGRVYDDLKAFADENLKPMCSPKNLDLCDDEKKAEINKFMAMPAEELKTMIEEKEGELAKIDADFQTFVEGLQSQYEEMTKKVETDKAEIKKAGLGIMKSVRAAQAAKESGKDEL